MIELQPLRAELETKLDAETLNMLATKNELALFNSKLAGKVDQSIVRDHENRLMEISSVMNSVSQASKDSTLLLKKCEKDLSSCIEATKLAKTDVLGLSKQLHAQTKESSEQLSKFEKRVFDLRKADQSDLEDKLACFPTHEVTDRLWDKTHKLASLDQLREAEGKFSGFLL